MKINYINGDATNPIGNDNRIIIHICNDIGKWGKGFVLAISKKWKLPEKEYRKWSNDKSFRLGNIQTIQVDPKIWVINMIAQHDIKIINNIKPIRYEAVRECFKKVTLEVEKYHASIHMPKIGCGLAGGKWEIVEQIILDELIVNNISVTVYNF